MDDHKVCNAEEKNLASKLLDPRQMVVHLESSLTVHTKKRYASTMPRSPCEVRVRGEPLDARAKKTARQEDVRGSDQ